jgi:hypothetical protein
MHTLLLAHSEESLSGQENSRTFGNPVTGYLKQGWKDGVEREIKKYFFTIRKPP